MKPKFKEYGKGEFLGSGEDMAHHTYDAYKVDDEIHIVYENEHVASEKIDNIQGDMDKYLWTPYVEWAHR